MVIYRLTKAVSWVNYRIISLRVKQDKHVTYLKKNRHFLVFARRALYATISRLMRQLKRFMWKDFWVRFCFYDISNFTCHHHPCQLGLRPDY